MSETAKRLVLVGATYKGAPGTTDGDYVLHFARKGMGGAVLIPKDAAPEIIVELALRHGIPIVTPEQHDARVTELLAANSREVERRRAAEEERDVALAQIEAMAQRINEVQADMLRDYLGAKAEAGPKAQFVWWRQIDTLPGNDGQPPDLNGDREPLILARTADGRRMIWRPSILRAAMKPGQPAHLSFPAVEWMPVP